MTAAAGRNDPWSVGCCVEPLEIIAVRISVSGPSEVTLWLLCGDGTVLTLDSVAQPAAAAVADVVIRRRVTVERVETTTGAIRVELRRERRIGALALGSTRMRLACEYVTHDTAR